MREIKFRFYGVNAKKMYLGESGRFNSNDLIETQDWKVMQYTGLKDCNDVEIYEGDIIQDIDYGIMECKYLHGSFVWYSKNGFNIKLMNYIPNIEVIGNIYENPELLLEK